MKTFFSYCLFSLKHTLKAHQVDIIDNDAIEGCDAAGDFFIVPCSPGILNVSAIKQVCEDFERNHPLGRFIDADINDEQGVSVSSGKSKLCFFCLEKPAIECRRGNVHKPEELRSFMFTKMANYCDKQKEAMIVKKLSSLARKAILFEISLTPKPGLVDKISNGSHTDMNYHTFIDSTTAISSWFSDLVREGFLFRGSDLTKALPLIRNIGLRMETEMYKATRNINTQKGIIFFIGLSLFSCGILYRQGDHLDADKFCGIVSDICKDIVNNELVGNQKSIKSHGEDIFLKYGFTGARGEAEGGFRTVFEFGLPQLERVTSLTDETLIRSFLAIAANSDDTNILHRSNPSVLSEFKKLCKEALENFNQLNYSKVIDFCKNKKISPGGSADLLAVTIFVWLVKNAEGKAGFANYDL